MIFLGNITIHTQITSKNQYSTIIICRRNKRKAVHYNEYFMKRSDTAIIEDITEKSDGCT